MKKHFKEIINKSIKFLLDKFNIDNLLNSIRKEKKEKIFKLHSICGKNVIFGGDSEIWNLQRNPKAIEIDDNTIIEGELQVLGYGGKIQIGKNCYIGHDTKIWSGESVTIGDDVLISHNVGIIDTNSHELDAAERAKKHREYLRNGHSLQKGLIQTAPIIIEKKAWINFDVIILKGVTIGEGAIVAAGSIVTKNVARYTMVAGVPAKFVKELL